MLLFVQVSAGMKNVVLSSPSNLPSQMLHEDLMARITKLFKAIDTDGNGNLEVEVNPQQNSCT